MELRHVEHVHLAHPVIAEKRLLAALGALFALRLIAAAALPLSADEAYYWLWSRHLSAGYFDHPPAIAWMIRAGTVLFGQSAIAVRIAGVLASLAATWFVYRAAVLLLADRKAGLLAALLFNLSLMVTVEMLAATPDSPQILTASAFLWALAKVGDTGRGKWWLAVGIAGGLGLLSKYSTLFLGAGALGWLIVSPPMRRWLVSPWPYLGAAVALMLFLPNLFWNADHGWATLVFQFGRIAGEHLTAKYLGEFLGAQLLLATPFLFVLAIMGLAAARRSEPNEALIACLLWPSIAYFLVHALHDRVQGNWPCYLYPALTVAAVMALRRAWSGWWAPLARGAARLAIPVAAVLLIAGYAQALLGVLPQGSARPPAGRRHARRGAGVGRAAYRRRRRSGADHRLRLYRLVRFLQPVSGGEPRRGIPLAQFGPADRRRLHQTGALHHRGAARPA